MGGHVARMGRWEMRRKARMNRLLGKRIILKLILEKLCLGLRIGLNWLRMETGGVILSTRSRNFVFQKGQ